MPTMALLSERSSSTNQPTDTASVQGAVWIEGASFEKLSGVELNRTAAEEKVAINKAFEEVAW